ncbi:TIGR02680 family protein [Jiangella alkaliphila]|uniref:TIGR02680 family protein n=1 Tax=Jiangella alkaliphila TaxID=419479 RepID=A0A1H2IWI2_9ACTN|nr:TIGR02680 family protein [Jiangella alkaliphila]SDU48499.1 TIGR02680 family protein [Jiangella alkaliphila]
MTAPTVTTAALPTPTSRRWKPLRAGLVDIFYYDVEEFHFHDGRLLLRGNNGTGKSKVLALTLPFLLDGELSPHRVEPDGDRQKRMEWNLLLGGKHPHPERVGYTWLEFGRIGPDGTPEFKTIGCGLKAVKDRGIARHWYVVTPQRVGDDLLLLGPGRVPLTRERLRDAVEGRGMVYDRASDYRRAVDEALFGLGERRYEALVNLLIQLRQPQLSKKPDEKRLSTALTEALPPVSPALIRTVADAFRGLDEERHAIDGLREAEQAAAEFLRHYRRYAELAARRMARGPRETHSRYEWLGRDLAEAERRYAEAQGELDAAEELLAELADAKGTLEAQRDALQQSPEMRDAERLQHLEADADRLEAYARRVEGDRERLDDELRRRRVAAERAAGRERQAAATFEAADGTATESAERARCAAEHQDVAGRWETDLAAARRETAALADRRTRAVEELERLLAAVAAESARLEQARREVDRLTAQLQADAERVTHAEQAIHDETAGLSARYSAYLGGVSEFRVTDADAVLSLLETWAVNVDGVNPAAEAVDQAVRTATTELGRQEAGLEAERQDRRAATGEITDEIQRLEAGGHDAPPVPYTRDPSGRVDRPGAPFWKVVDFADDVPSDHRAGVEAALEAAGILDAWLSPDGTLRGADDTVVVAAADGAGTETGARRGSCRDVLRPAVDRADVHAAALSDDLVDAVLGAIGLDADDGGDHHTWVTVDGRWANGVLTGSWHKPDAVFIGDGARERARRARLERLRAELAELESRLAELAAALEEVAARRRGLDEERRARPDDQALREAHVKLTGEHERRRSHQEEHSAAEEAAREQEAQLVAVRHRAAEFAADVGLPVDTDELATVRAALGDYRVALAGLWPAAEALLDARETARIVAEELAGTAERLEEASSSAVEARERAAAAAETYRVLHETVGDAIEELRRKLAAVAEELRQRDENERATRDVANQARENRGRAEGAREKLTEEITEAETKRDAAVEEFRQFAATGLLRVALPELEIPGADESWAATPAVHLARSVNAALESADDSDGPWDRVQKRVSEEHKLLSDAMARHGHSVGLTLRAGVMVVDVVFQGRTREIPELTMALRTEIDDRAQLLSAREREILENHLLNEVAGTLHELIAAAEDEVRAMNDELAARPTSTGMRLRLIWRSARHAPDGLDRVRDKLRQTVDAWSEADRSAVGEFLQRQIAREHAENPAVGWYDQLTTALDYRTWHEFTIQRYQDGQWRPATGPASGGERALVASVPLFAAASAHYKSAANPYAPRLVALDEAFAGVDDDSRAKCLGLLATFDMDVVMTSEREWGCYPEVPGLAISHLARRDGIDAVLVTPWRWDGRDRRRVERPVPVLPPAEPAPRAGGAEQADLFGQG